MKLLKTLMLTSMVICTSAFASPTDKSVEELAKYSSYENLFYAQINEALVEDRMKLTYIVANDPKLSDEERKQAIKLYDDYAEGLLKSLDTPETKASLKKSYLSAAKSVYNQKEIDAQLAFYGSVDGQNALKKEGVLLSTYLKNAEEASKNTVKSYVDKNQKKMEETISKILKK